MINRQRLHPRQEPKSLGLAMDVDHLRFKRHFIIIIVQSTRKVGY